MKFLLLQISELGLKNGKILRNINGKYLNILTYVVERELRKKRMMEFDTTPHFTTQHNTTQHNTKKQHNTTQHRKNSTTNTTQNKITKHR